jgi:hypothetical protein
MVISLPEMLEQAWARALPGREAAAQNEVMRSFYATLIAEKARQRADWVVF